MEPLPPLWIDRRDAGRQLARRCCDLRGRESTVLVGLPRGGVAVAAAMAEELNLPVLPWAVRKLADPTWPELAIGAVAPGGVVLWADPRHEDPPMVLEQRRALVGTQQQELARRQRHYGDPDPRSLQGLHLVVVDDGIATGLTARSALLSLRLLQPASLTLAVPVMDRQVLPDFERLVERLVVLALVRQLEAVGRWYEHFEQLDDAEVLRLLSRVSSVCPS
jgi:putative phosphoribosyl transferase